MDLGKLELEVPRTKVLRILLGGLGIPFSALMLWGTVASLTEKPPEPIAAVITAALGLPTAGFLWWFFRREAASSIAVYERGIRLQRGSVVKSLLWAEIREVWFEAIKVHAGGLVGAAVGAAVNAVGSRDQGISERSTNLKLRLVGRQGEKLAIDSNFKGVGKVVDAILSNAVPMLLARARDLVRNGSAATFGEIAISMGGVSRKGGDPIAFPDIEYLRVRGGKVRLKKKGAWLDSFAAPVARVPNVFVLIELFSELATGGQGDRVALDKSFVRSSFV